MSADENDEEWICAECKKGVYLEEFDMEVPEHLLCWPCASNALDVANAEIAKLKDEIRHAISRAKEPIGNPATFPRDLEGIIEWYVGNLQRMRARLDSALGELNREINP